jgi:hypothetical protein
MDHDDGTRGWGENLRPLITRIGTSATNKYLKDPIPSRPHAAPSNSTGTQAAPVANSPPNNSVPTSGTLDGRLVAVQKEISAIKSGILNAQKHAMVKAGKFSHVASSSQGVVLPSITSSQAVCKNDNHRPAVLGLLAEAHNKENSTDMACVEAAEFEDNGAELKKRKRAKAINDNQVVDLMCSGDMGLENDVTRQGNGIDDVMCIDNPMCETNNVTAGPDDQACREP